MSDHSGANLGRDFAMNVPYIATLRHLEIQKHFFSVIVQKRGDYQPTYLNPPL